MQRTSWGEMRQSFYPVEAGLGLNSSAHNNCFLFIHGDRRAQRNTRKRMPHPVAKESMTTRRNFRGIHAIRHGILPSHQRSTTAHDNIYNTGQFLT